MRRKRIRPGNCLKWTSLFLLWGSLASAKIIESTYKVPEGMVFGGAFIDRFLPVPLLGELRSDAWGADNVIPRDVTNGIEDAEYSYWGGNIVRGDDGKEHLFVCRWPESSYKGEEKQGHRLWWSSTVVHAVSDSPLGPFKVVEEIGKGHNPEIYRTKEGSWIIGVMGGRAYRADSLNGPWEEIETTFDWIDKEGNPTNRTYVVREDGRVLMMNKRGYLFISERADEQFKQITPKSFYPHIEKGHLEDPVMWKDEVQYHAVVNDCYGRVALYFRSPDGIRWKWAPGKAYDIHIMNHVGGTSEKWFKFERPKVRQDQYGRATHMNFAVIDVLKADENANDNHSSKNIVLPLQVSRRLEILNKNPITPDTKEIRLKILAEEGFDPRKDIKADSLTFGAPEAVNFGNGCKAVSSKISGSDLIVTFAGQGNGITEGNFTAKLIGRAREGDLLFGYAKLP